jgi:hypothetical protein
MGFLVIKLDRRSCAQTPCLPFGFLGNFLSFLGKGEGGGLGFKAQGFPVTCPGLEFLANNFIIKNLKEPWRLGPGAQEGFESPLLYIFYTHTTSMNLEKERNSEPIFNTIVETDKQTPI